jgi:ribosome-associated protein
MRVTQLRGLILDALDDAKARDVAILDVRKVAVFTDYMIIVTGTSSRHVVAVADNVVRQLREHARRPTGVEGMEGGDWVLIDYGDVVVHVMRAQTRDFYSLEKLWSEAKRLKR